MGGLQLGKRFGGDNIMMSNLGDDDKFPCTYHCMKILTSLDANSLHPEIMGGVHHTQKKYLGWSVERNRK